MTTMREPKIAPTPGQKGGSSGAAFLPRIYLDALLSKVPQQPKIEKVVFRETVKQVFFIGICEHL